MPFIGRDPEITSLRAEKDFARPALSWCSRHSCLTILQDAIQCI